MTSYVAITDGEIDPESPITTTLMTELRDNPIAITEGASGAPRIQNKSFVESVSASSSFRVAGCECSNYGTTNRKVGEFVIPVDGTYKTELRGRVNAAATGSVRIYKNGAAFGTNRTTTSTTFQADGSGWFEDLAFVAGDKIQIYLDNSSGIRLTSATLTIYSDDVNLPRMKHIYAIDYSNIQAETSYAIG